MANVSLWDLLLWYLVLSVTFVRAVPRNIQVDDEFGDEMTGSRPIYSSQGWTPGAGCDGCAVHPDTAQAFKGTWHDTTHFPGFPDGQRTVQFTFTGTALYAYIILLSSRLTSLSFTMDGQSAGTYLHLPEQDPTWMYNVSVYSNNSLQHGQHTIMIQTLEPKGQDQNLFLFDYFMYTFDPDLGPPPSPGPLSTTRTGISPLLASPAAGAAPVRTNASAGGSTAVVLIASPPTSPAPGAVTSSSDIPAILGGTFGCLAVVVLFSLAFFLLRRHLNEDTKRPRGDDLVCGEVQPFPAQPFPAQPFTAQSSRALSSASERTDSVARSIAKDSRAASSSSPLPHGSPVPTDRSGSTGSALTLSQQSHSTLPAASLVEAPSDAREIARQIRRRERDVAKLARQQKLNQQYPNVAGNSSSGDPALANQIQALKRELQRLRAQAELVTPSPP